MLPLVVQMLSVLYRQGEVVYWADYLMDKYKVQFLLSCTACSVLLPTAYTMCYCCARCPAFHTPSLPGVSGCWLPLSGSPHLSPPCSHCALFNALHFPRSASLMATQAEGFLRPCLKQPKRSCTNLYPRFPPSPSSPSP